LTGRLRCLAGAAGDGTQPGECRYNRSEGSMAMAVSRHDVNSMGKFFLHLVPRRENGLMITAAPV
jgi:hypothetical protein